MISHEIIVHSTPKQLFSNHQKVFTEGASVLVKVLSSEGNGKYEGFVGGNRIIFSSNKPLKIGDSFVAIINSQNGKIVLSPKEVSFGEVQTLQTLNNNQIASFLNSLGLNSDELALHIFKQMKQLRMPFDRQMQNKIYDMSSKSKGKEKKLSELLMLFQQKDIFLNEDEAFDLLDYLDGKENTSEETYKMVNAFNEKNGSWYFFIFDLVHLNDNSKIGNGNIKIFFDHLNKLKKMNLLCNYNNRNFRFNFVYERNEISSILFNIDDVSENKGKVIEKVIKQMFSEESKCSVSFKPAYELDGTQCETEDIEIVMGTV